MIKVTVGVDDIKDCSFHLLKMKSSFPTHIGWKKHVWEKSKSKKKGVETFVKVFTMLVADLGSRWCMPTYLCACKVGTEHLMQLEP